MGDIYLYRITHIDNIPHILERGITHRNSPNANQHYIPIGDSSLIKFRADKHITIDKQSICLGDYIPFYFGVRMPMLYVIQQGGNFVPKATPAKDIVYVAVSSQRIIERLGNYCYFCDGHATDCLTEFYTAKDFNRIDEIIDWDAVKARIWAGEGVDTDVKRRKQAEFLVGKDIPADCIHGFVCYDNAAFCKMVKFGVPAEMIRIFPKAYY